MTPKQHSVSDRLREIEKLVDAQIEAAPQTSERDFATTSLALLFDVSQVLSDTQEQYESLKQERDVLVALDEIEPVAELRRSLAIAEKAADVAESTANEWRRELERTKEQFYALHQAATKAWALLPVDYQAHEILRDALLSVSNPAKISGDVSRGTRESPGEASDSADASSPATVSFSPSNEPRQDNGVAPSMSVEQGDALSAKDSPPTTDSGNQPGRTGSPETLAINPTKPLTDESEETLRIFVTNAVDHAGAASRSLAHAALAELLSRVASNPASEPKP